MFLDYTSFLISTLGFLWSRTISSGAWTAFYVMGDTKCMTQHNQWNSIAKLNPDYMVFIQLTYSFQRFVLEIQFFFYIYGVKRIDIDWSINPELDGAFFFLIYEIWIALENLESYHLCTYFNKGIYKDVYSSAIPLKIGVKVKKT